MLWIFNFLVTPCVSVQDEEAVKRLTATAGTKSKLAKPVQELIKMIFDVESMKKAMVEFEVRLACHTLKSGSSGSLGYFYHFARCGIYFTFSQVHSFKSDG